MINNSVRNGWGKVIGFRCSECDDVVPSMWGTACNKYRKKERRHREIVEAIKKRGEK